MSLSKASKSVQELLDERALIFAEIEALDGKKFETIGDRLDAYDRLQTRFEQIQEELASR